MLRLRARCWFDRVLLALTAPLWIRSFGRYGWGRNAPDLVLPDGVGFSVGHGTSVRYIVAQVSS